MALTNAGARGQCSNRRRVSNKRRVSIKRQGFEVRVLINAEFYGILFSPVVTHWSGLAIYTSPGDGRA